MLLSVEHRILLLFLTMCIRNSRFVHVTAVIYITG